jgi:transposase
LEKVFEVPKGLILESVEEEDGKTVLNCRSRKQKVKCKFCGGTTSGYDKRVTNKKHTVVSGKTVWLKITRQRVKCKDCKKVFVMPLDGISRELYTDHFTQQVQEKARNQDFSTISRETGMSCATVSTRMSRLNIDLIHAPEKKA